MSASAGLSGSAGSAAKTTKAAKEVKAVSTAKTAAVATQGAAAVAAAAKASSKLLRRSTPAPSAPEAKAAAGAGVQIASASSVTEVEKFVDMLANTPAQIHDVADPSADSDPTFPYRDGMSPHAIIPYMSASAAAATAEASDPRRATLDVDESFPWDTASVEDILRELRTKTRIHEKPAISGTVDELLKVVTSGKEGFLLYFVAHYMSLPVIPSGTRPQVFFAECCPRIDTLAPAATRARILQNAPDMTMRIQRLGRWGVIGPDETLNTEEQRVRIEQYLECVRKRIDDIDAISQKLWDAQLEHFSNVVERHRAQFGHLDRAMLHNLIPTVNISRRRLDVMRALLVQDRNTTHAPLLLRPRDADKQIRETSALYDALLKSGKLVVDRKGCARLVPDETSAPEAGVPAMTPQDDDQLLALLASEGEGAQEYKSSESPLQRLSGNTLQSFRWQHLAPSGDNRLLAIFDEDPDQPGYVFFCPLTTMHDNGSAAAMTQLDTRIKWLFNLFGVRVSIVSLRANDRGFCDLYDFRINQEEQAQGMAKLKQLASASSSSSSSEAATEASSAGAFGDTTSKQSVRFEVQDPEALDMQLREWGMSIDSTLIPRIDPNDTAEERRRKITDGLSHVRVTATFNLADANKRPIPGTARVVEADSERLPASDDEDDTGDAAVDEGDEGDDASSSSRAKVKQKALKTIRAVRPQLTRDVMNLNLEEVPPGYPLGLEQWREELQSIMAEDMERLYSMTLGVSRDVSLEQFEAENPPMTEEQLEQKITMMRRTSSQSRIALDNIASNMRSSMRRKRRVPNALHLLKLLPAEYLHDRRCAPNDTNLYRLEALGLRALYEWWERFDQAQELIRTTQRSELTSVEFASAPINEFPTSAQLYRLIASKLP